MRMTGLTIGDCIDIEGVVGVAVEHAPEDAAIAENDDNHGDHEGDYEEADVEDEDSQGVRLPITVVAGVSGFGPCHHKHGHAQQARSFKKTMFLNKKRGDVYPIIETNSNNFASC